VCTVRHVTSGRRLVVVLIVLFQVFVSMTVLSVCVCACVFVNARISAWVCKQQSPCICGEILRRSKTIQYTYVVNAALRVQILCFVVVSPEIQEHRWRNIAVSVEKDEIADAAGSKHVFSPRSMSYYKDRLGFDPDEPTANGDGSTFRKSKRGYEENLCKFKGLSFTFIPILYYVRV